VLTRCRDVSAEAHVYDATLRSSGTRYASRRPQGVAQTGSIEDPEFAEGSGGPQLRLARVRLPTAIRDSSQTLVKRPNTHHDEMAATEVGRQACPARRLTGHWEVKRGVDS
jgi:hypothetical protein